MVSDRGIDQIWSLHQWCYPSVIENAKRQTFSQPFTGNFPRKLDYVFSVIGCGYLSTWRVHAPWRFHPSISRQSFSARDFASGNFPPLGFCSSWLVQLVIFLACSLTRMARLFDSLWKFGKMRHLQLQQLSSPSSRKVALRTTFYTATKVHIEHMFLHYGSCYQFSPCCSNKFAATIKFAVDPNLSPIEKKPLHFPQDNDSTSLGSNYLFRLGKIGQPRTVTRIPEAWWSQQNCSSFSSLLHSR